MYDTHDTIAAVATSVGPAARGIVRVSGPNAVGTVLRCFTADDGSPLEQFHRATVISGRLTVGFDLPTSADKRTLSFACDLFLWPGTRSYTRQPMAELHTLGSPPLVEAILKTLCESGARLAEPGEFTLRAFLGGRLDLTQAEAVLGVIDSHGEEDLAAALAQLAGGLARPLTMLRDDLLQLLAELEAGLDFVDEDIEFVSREQIATRLASAAEVLAGVASQLAGRETATRLERVALVGPPNAGKSSLFNALAGRYRSPGATTGNWLQQAIVSPQRGTTRDYIAARVCLGGVECELIDTAGVEACDTTVASTTNGLATIDVAAQTLAAEQREHATLRIFCVDGSLPQDDAALLETIRRTDVTHDIVVLTKADLAQSVPLLSTESNVFAVSSMTGRGIDLLANELRSRIRSGRARGGAQTVAATAERCRESVRLAEAAIIRALEIVKDKDGDELIAGELRLAIYELGRVVGAVYTDDLLDRIFSTFCIGK